ncbi:hypothetical protein D9C73_010801 [Collichthys lucidus]|uniref:Uncharacterized protein n=1 Tax=Collichthys lucidus TaxID=240159 RepID=A0A4U5UQG5_COLLU|nr:hypothetical protein D9C73_010801 [Collichthys lucidus]
MRIHQALSGGKRVSFADTTGGDLVDVKEFVAFDSDDEEDIARWEEEEAKYRKPEREPTYHVQVEFNSPTGSALLQAVHNDSAQTNIGVQQKRGILKPPKDYSMNDDFDSEDEQEKEEEEEAGTSKPGLVRPTAMCPVIVQPEIDIEIAVHPSGPSVPPNQEPPFVDGTLSSHTVSPVQPNKSQPSPRLHSELGNQTAEQPADSSPSALLPDSTPSLQESRRRSDSSQSGGEEIPPSETSCMHLSTAETNLWPETREDGSTDSPASRPCFELLAECVSAPSVTQGSELEVAAGLSELASGLSEGSTSSAEHHEGSTPALSVSREGISGSRSGVVSFSIVLHEPSALFLIGLLYVLHRL